MCGINGVITNQPAQHELATVIQQMNDRIIHRGPDEDGVYTATTDTSQLVMGMRRLSIIDLSTGTQPIYSDDKKIAIVFNGEIYNYRELKQQLQQEGVTFKTTSDTEVIVKLYEQHGVASFAWLDGMFAFSIHDLRNNKVFITRDFFGEKPLYYTRQSEGFFWASELKSILPQLKQRPPISKRGLNLFFRLTYIPAPHTIYEGIYKLRPNHYIEYDLTTQEFEIHGIGEERYERPKKVSFEKAKKEVHDGVFKSVASRSIADVPLGTFLSGGVDSSIVSWCLSKLSSKKIDTFSIGFEKASFDESDKARTVANLIQSNHHEFIINEEHLKHNIHEILNNFDEPFADSSALATYLVANKTRDHVKVALTGDGGDEVFGGYNKYYMGKLNRRYTSIVPKVLHKTIKKASKGLLKTTDDDRGLRFKLDRLVNAVDYDGGFYWDIISLGFQPADLQAVMNNGTMDPHVFEEYESAFKKNPTSLTDFRKVDQLMSLEGDMLVKVDRTSMLTSLECRAPFLNKQLWQYTQSLPESYLMKGWNKKYILKKAFEDAFPKGFLDKSKRGFGVPVGDWLRAGLKQELEQYTETSFLEKQRLFNVEPVQHMVHQHLTGQKDRTFNVWTYFCFQKWYKNTYSAL